MHIFPTNKPVVLITMGDPAGIGPEIIGKSVAQTQDLLDKTEVAIIGDKEIILSNILIFIC